MRSLYIAFVIVTTLYSLQACEAFEIKRDFTHKESQSYVDIIRDGKVMAKYVYAYTPKPYIYPLALPDGTNLLRTPALAKDGSFRRGFWVGIQSLNGVDFWKEGDKAGKIVQTSLAYDSVLPGYWNIHALLDWQDAKGKIVAQEDRRYSFLSCEYGMIISCAIELKATNADINIGDSHKGFFSLSPIWDMKNAHILNSNGDIDAACIGKKARWCDYSAEIDGKSCGIAVFDMPSNFGFPAKWSIADDGLFCLNPFWDKDKGGKVFNIPHTSYKLFVYVTLIHDKPLDSQTLNEIADQLCPAQR